ncbi:MAG: Wzz/FepE/Etk N-terminal domain-containing protein [Frankiaceae bacterium]
MRYSGPQDSSLVTLSDYGHLLWRRKWIIVTFAVLGLLLGIGYTFIATKTYRATASVLVKPVSLDPTASQGASKLVNLDTEAQVVRSTAVGDIAGKQMKPAQGAGTVAGAVSVTVPANSFVLRISYEAGTAEAARAGANLVAGAYLLYKTESDKQQIAAKTAEVSQQIDALNTDLRNVSGQLQNTPVNSANAPFLQARERVISTHISSLQDRQAALAGVAVEPGQVIDQATLPATPASPGLPVNVAAGLVAGLLLGCVVALLWDRRHPRFWTRANAEEASGLPVLIEIHNTKQPEHARSMELAGTRAYEAYRRLANSLVRLGDAENGRVVVVTSASADLSAGAVATNLACVLARAGNRTVFLSADFKLSTGLDVLDLANGYGLAEVLLGEAGIGDVARPVTMVPGLVVLTAGQNRDRASNLIPSSRTRTLLDTLRRTAEYVIVEASPVPVSADAQALASLADAVVVTAVTGRTGRPEFVEVRRLLEQVRARVLGLVVLAHGGSRPADMKGAARRKAVKRDELAAIDG